MGNKYFNSVLVDLWWLQEASLNSNMMRRYQKVFSQNLIALATIDSEI